MQTNLTIGERLIAITFLNEFKGGLEKMKSIIEDAAQFDVTNEEWLATHRVYVVGAEDPASPTREITDLKDLHPEEKLKSIKWDDKDEVPKSVEIHRDVVSYLLDTIKKKSDEGLFTLADRNVINLKEKLEK